MGNIFTNALNDLLNYRSDRGIKDDFLYEIDDILSTYFSRYRIRDSIRESMRQLVESCTPDSLRGIWKRSEVREWSLDYLYQRSLDKILFHYIENGNLTKDGEELKQIALTCLDLLCKEGAINEKRRAECVTHVHESIEKAKGWYPNCKS